MTEIRTPVWRRWRISVPFALATIWGAYNLRPVPAEASRVSLAMIVQDADSAQYAVAWGVASGANMYRVYTGPDDPIDGTWVAELETDDVNTLDVTIWVPLNATETLMYMCVEPINRQTFGERRGPPACTQYTAPAALVTPGQPGTPTVNIIPTVASRIDSISIHPAALDLEVGEDTELRAFVWIGDVPTICATMDTGEIGWTEVTFTDAARFEFVVPSPARYVEDPNCGELEWVSADPSILTVTPNPPVDLGPDPVLIQAAR